MSIFKHFGEQANQHGGQLFWSQALNGLPFRGPFAPTLTQEEIESDVRVQGDFKFKLFDLTVKEDADYYEWVMDRIVNGWFQKLHIERSLDAAKGRVLVYIEWTQRYGELSPQALAAKGQPHVIQSKPSQSITAPLSQLAGLQDPSAGI